jgi:N-acetylglucosamine-6-phosphate deacetylase
VLKELSGRDVRAGAGLQLAFDQVVLAVNSTASADDLYLAPGWIDLQVNGFAGVDYNAPGTPHDEIARSIEVMFSTGVTRFYPTVITGGPDEMRGALANLAAARETLPAGEAMDGLHVEGPHISAEEGPRGAHPVQWVRPPDVDEFHRWQEAARGHVRLVTLSPEWPEAPAYIEALVDEGVVVAIGHTSATSAQIADAVSAGATMSTHLGNGSHNVLRRHPNYIWDQLAEDRLTASFIADGIHVPPAFLKAAIRAKQIGRSVLVTDASTPAGSPPGRYQLGAQELELTADGRVVLAGQDRLAGSALRMDDAVANAIRFAGVSLPDAVTMATTNAARAGRVPGRHIGLAGGERADFVRFHFDPSTGEVRIQETYLSGRCVFHRSHAAVVGSFA